MHRPLYNNATFLQTFKVFLKVGRGLPLGGTQFFFGGCVLRWFQNEGSRERIFLEKCGSWERKFWKNLGLES